MRVPAEIDAGISARMIKRSRLGLIFTTMFLIERQAELFRWRPFLPLLAEFFRFPLHSREPESLFREQPQS
jgi:hypothetical protein